MYSGTHFESNPDKRPTPQERPLDNVNLNINLWISTPDERPPLLKDHISGTKGVASQEGFQHIYIQHKKIWIFKILIWIHVEKNFVVE